jgi:transglutaminase-like putative cysteine protease
VSRAASTARPLTLGLAHELGLCASLSAATLIVLLGGSFPPWVWLAMFAPALSLAMARRGVVAPGFSGTLLAFAALGAGISTLVQGGLESAVFAGGATLLGLLAARVVTRRTLEHDLQALLLGLVLVLAGSVLNVTLSYFLVFVAYAVATVWALSTRQLLAGAEQTARAALTLTTPSSSASSMATQAAWIARAAARARDRDDVITPLFFVASGAVSLAVLGAAVVVFVSFPRIGFGELGMLLRKESQLPPAVGFAGNPRGLSTSSEVVARVRGVPVDRFLEGLYLRGIVYDELTLDAFAQSAPDATSAPVVDRRPSLPGLAWDAERAGRVEVTLTPIAGALLFTLGHTTTAMTLAGGAANPNRSLPVAGRDRHDELRFEVPLSSPLRYELRGSLAVAGVVPAPSPRVPALTEPARFLQTPDGIDPALVALVDEALRGASPGVAVDRGSLPVEEVVARLRRFLLGRFRYSLEPELAGRAEPLKAFLLSTRAGHCELFAGGFALLLRLAGIPARVVGGFQGGALADDGAVVFQKRHAHAWVEWWKDDVGWIVDDATPVPGQPRDRMSGLDGLVEQMRRFWDDRVVDYSLRDQQDALRTAADALRGLQPGRAALAGVAVVVGIVVIASVVRGRRRGRDAARQGDALSEAILAAVARLRGAPPSPTATLREVIAGCEPAVLRAAVDACERARFGEQAVAPDELRRLLDGLATIRATPPGGRPA